MSITRRLFLRNTAAAGAVAATVAAPAVAAEPEMTIRERALWHMRELERLLFEDGADKAYVTVVGMYTSPDDCKLLGIYPGGRLGDRDGLFAQKGGAA